MSGAIMAQAYGLGGGNQLALQGEFSDTSWLATLSGNFRRLPVLIIMQGMFDPAANSGEFLSWGVTRGDLWQGAGLWSFADVQPDGVTMLWDSGAAILGSVGERNLGRHFRDPYLWQKSNVGQHMFWQAEGEYVNSDNGVDAGGRQVQLADWSIPPGPPMVGNLQYELRPAPMGLIGSVDFDQRLVDTIMWIPEPATGALLAIAALALEGGRRRTRRRAYPQTSL